MVKLTFRELKESSEPNLTQSVSVTATRSIMELSKHFQNLSLTDKKELEAPIVQNVSPWKLEEMGISFSDWCFQPENIYVGLQLKRLLGPFYSCVPREAKKWECRYTGPDRIRRYGNYIRKNHWDNLFELSGKTIGCYCYKNENCHCKMLVKLFKKKYRIE